jgi:hypothetical protein
MSDMAAPRSGARRPPAWRRKRENGTPREAAEVPDRRRRGEGHLPPAGSPRRAAGLQAGRRTWRRWK